WRWVAAVHIPCALWGILIEYRGGICPLTPLENSLRARAGQQGYAGGFVEHYVLPVIYPKGLTAGVQVALGTLVLTVNLLAYSLLIRRLTRGSCWPLAATSCVRCSPPALPCPRSRAT